VTSGSPPRPRRSRSRSVASGSCPTAARPGSCRVSSGPPGPPSSRSRAPRSRPRKPNGSGWSRGSSRRRRSPPKPATWRRSSPHWRRSPWRRRSGRSSDRGRSDLETALEEEAWRQGIAGATEDHAEGIAAFVEKRSPRFRGS
jgi:hypothetical protein